MVRFLAFSLVSAVILQGQHKFSWQDACFNNPSAPYCMGHEDAIKRSGRSKDAVLGNASPLSSTPLGSAPLPVVSGGIDWRFADPLADALAGFNFKGLSASPFARGWITQWGAKEGLTEADMKKKFDGLSDVGQVAISVRDGRIVAFITGSSISSLPALQEDWKAVPVSGNALLVGHADAVDEAVRRIALNGPLAELTRLSQERQANSEFWAAGSGRFIGPQAENAGLARFVLAVSVPNRFASDAAFEFNEVPKVNTIQFWPALGDASVEGNVVHIRTSMEAGEAQQSFGQIAGSPLSQRLEALITAGHYLPVRDTTVLKKTKPVIYGLDDGPRVVDHVINK